MKLIIFVVAIIIVAALSFSVVMQINEKAGKAVPASNALGGFCGSSMMTSCTVDSNCRASGCSAQICGGINDGIVATICEWKDCYDAIGYHVSCKCINNACQWIKVV